MKYQDNALPVIAFLVAFGLPVVLFAIWQHEETVIRDNIVNGNVRYGALPGPGKSDVNYNKWNGPLVK